MPTQPPTIAEISIRHWLVVIGAGLLMSLNVLVFLAAGMLLPPLAESLGVGLGQVMVFVSINMVAGALVLAVAGPFLIRRFGSRWLSLLGGLVTGASIFAVSLVTELWQLIAALIGFALVTGPRSWRPTGAGRRVGGAA